MQTVEQTKTPSLSPNLLSLWSQGVTQSLISADQVRQVDLIPIIDDTSEAIIDVTRLL